MDDGNDIERSISTADLKHDHLTVRRVGAIAQRCSHKLYSNDEDIPIDDIEILSVVIEEFIDAFHHGKEELSFSCVGTDWLVSEFFRSQELKTMMVVVLCRFVKHQLISDGSRASSEKEFAEALKVQYGEDFE